MEISMIVAHGKNYEMGLKNKLLWNIPEDLQNFKNLTMGHHILMGRKTFESIGKPLPNILCFQTSPTKKYITMIKFDICASRCPIAFPKIYCHILKN